MKIMILTITLLIAMLVNIYHDDENNAILNGAILLFIICFFS